MLTRENVYEDTVLQRKYILAMFGTFDIYGVALVE
jgi:hypothetical protein